MAVPRREAIDISIIRNILVRVGADIQPLQQNMTQAQRTMSSFNTDMVAATSATNSSMRTIGSVLGKLGGIVAAAFAVHKMVEFGQQSVQLASDLNEVQNVVDVTFGSMSNQINAWSKNAVTQFGMSELTAKKFASTMGAMLKSSGLAGQQITNMSEKMSGLAADMASFYNLDQQDAFQKIQSGLAGQVEPLRQLGINMSQANLQNYALQHGIQGNVQTMNQANQMLLRYQYLLSVTKDAQGDFARTSNSWANQTRLLNQQWQIFQTTMGQAFINILTPTLSVINALIAKLQVAAAYFKAFTEAIFGSASVVSQTTGGAAVSINDTSDALEGLGAAATKAGKAAQKSLAPFDQLNVMTKSTSASAGGAAGALSGLGGGVSVPTLNAPNTSGITAGVSAAADKIKAVVSGIKTFIDQHKAGIISAVAGIVSAFASFAVMSNWTAIVAGFGGAIEAVSAAFAAISLPILAGAVAIGVVTAAVVHLWQTNAQFRESIIATWNEIKTFVTKVATDMWNILKGLWDKYGATLIADLVAFFGSIQAMVLNVWNSFLKPTISGALELLSNLWTNHLKGLVQQIGEFIAKLVTGALEIWNKFISPVANFLIRTLGPAFSNIFLTAGGVVTTFVGVIADVAKGVFKALGGIIDFITGVFAGNWRRAWTGVKEIFSGVFGGIIGVFKGVINLVIDGINFMIRALNNIHFTVPVPGKGNVSIGIPHINTIPHLATGALAYGPTLAVIGDNKNASSDPEVVSPLSKLQSIITQAINSPSGGNGSSGPDTLVLKIGETEFARIAIKAINNYQRQSGVSLLSV